VEDEVDNEEKGEAVDNQQEVDKTRDG